MSTTSIRICRRQVEQLSFMFGVLPAGLNRLLVKYELDYWSYRLLYLLAEERCKAHARAGTSKNGAKKSERLRSCALDTCARDAYLTAMLAAEKKLWQLQARLGGNND